MNVKYARYTYTHDAYKCVVLWSSENRLTASCIEYHIKQLSRKKELLIKSNSFQ